MIGERLKEIRRNRGINQEELGAIIGVQSSAVSRYETDKDDPSDKIKVEIARYFNVSLDYLLGIIDEPMPYYSKDKFLRLPDWMTTNEVMMLSDFIGYFEYRKNKMINA